jgi:hypothetical protein
MASDIINSKIPNPNGDGVPVTLKANENKEGTGTSHFLICDPDGKLITAGGAGGEEVSIIGPLGSKLSAESVSVVIASDQGTLPLPNGAATEATLSDGSQVAQIKANTEKNGGGTSYSPLVDNDGHLQVDVLSGAGGGTQYNQGDALGATPTGTVSLGKDSGNVARAVATDTDGHLQVDILSSALPTGGATSALQTTGNESLATIAVDTTSVDSKITNGADATLVSAMQVAVYGRDSAGALDALKVDSQGHLEVVQDAEQQTSTIFSGTQTIAIAASHTFATTLDKNGSSQFNLLITSTTSAGDIDYGIEIDASDDNSTFYADANSAFGPGPGVTGLQNAQLGLNAFTPRYARFTFTNNSPSSSLVITSVKATRVMGI